MLRYLRVGKFAATCFERCESTFLVFTHEAAEPSNVGRKDCSQPSLNLRVDHE
jgi:hypothetical protein